MTRIVFIHGRAQQDQDALDLKHRWLQAWRDGLHHSGLALSLPEERIRFAYYGDTLRDMCAGMSEEEASGIIVKGVRDGAAAEAGVANLLDDYLRAAQAGEAEVDAEQRALQPAGVIAKGPQNWGWVQAVLRVLDRRLGPGAGAAIALLVNDVHQYLSNDVIRLRIEDGVRAAFSHDEDNIVVAHSLGTLVAYRLLHRLADEGGWRVPLLVTLGSPLGVRALRTRLRPIRFPGSVGRWFNALDPKDVVSLYPLNDEHFPVEPAIVNKTDVVNTTPNRHGIAGYLSDATVARTIHEAIAAR